VTSRQSARTTRHGRPEFETSSEGAHSFSTDRYTAGRIDSVLDGVPHLTGCLGGGPGRRQSVALLPECLPAWFNVNVPGRTGNARSDACTDRRGATECYVPALESTAPNSRPAPNGPTGRVRAEPRGNHLPSTPLTRGRQFDRSIPVCRSRRRSAGGGTSCSRRRGAGPWKQPQH
jgi:hypothetical protein